MIGEAIDDSQMFLKHCNEKYNFSGSAEQLQTHPYSEHCKVWDTISTFICIFALIWQLVSFDHCMLFCFDLICHRAHQLFVFPRKETVVSVPYICWH